MCTAVFNAVYDIAECIFNCEEDKDCSALFRTGATEQHRCMPWSQEYTLSDTTAPGVVDAYDGIK